MEIDKIFCGNNVDVLADFPGACIDLTVTSPPYDNLRLYNGYAWDFEALARELYRVTKPGGVVVWVVGDATVNGSETGTSFKQALYFMGCGFRLHDTMIYVKDKSPINDRRYQAAFEYMFVFSKGAPVTFNPIMKKNIGAGKKRFSTTREDDGSLTWAGGTLTKDEGVKPNVWKYETGHAKSTKDEYAFEHPAMFPESLARDHITSWSNPGDVVLDPFIGSGTTAKMAKETGRHWIGIDISEQYCKLAEKRIRGANVPLFV